LHLIHRATFAWAWQANAIAFLLLAFRQAVPLHLLGSAVGLMSHERKGRQHEIMYVIIKEPMEISCASGELGEWLCLFTLLKAFVSFFFLLIREGAIRGLFRHFISPAY